MTTISAMTDKKFPSEKGYYNGVHVVLHFNNEDGVDRREEQVDVDPDHDEEDMEDVRLDKKKVFKYNGGGM